MKIFLTAGGSGIKTSNSIEKKVTKDLLLEYVKDEAASKLIENDENDSFSIWGLSERGTIHPEQIEPGDRVFITRLSCVIYMGEILTWFLSEELNDEIWHGQKGWKYKIVLKNVTKVFIPDEESNKKRNMERHFVNHDISEESRSRFNKIEQLYENKMGFRYIFGITTNGNIQGNRMFENSKQILTRFEEYCLESEYQCIVKKV